jgi:hypothetical protein
LLRKAYTVGDAVHPCKSKKSAYKPGSVEGNHSSVDPRHQGPLAAYPEARTNRRCLEPCGKRLLPYLALLHVGFT